MKKRILLFFLLCLLTELGTSLWIWQGQPSHGLVDVYKYSFINYEVERLLPWTVIACTGLAFFALVLRLWVRSKP